MCIANGCRNRRTSPSLTGITFHRFPKNEYLREKWVKATKRGDWQPSEYSRLCSEHFLEEDFNRTLLRTTLREDRVPSVFPSYTPRSQVPKPKGKRKTKLPEPEEVIPIQLQISNTDRIEKTELDQVKIPVKKRKIKQEDDDNGDLQTSFDDILRKASLALDTKEDEYDYHGKTIAAKLRRIAATNYDQFLLADSLLNQVLFKALNSQLTVNTTVMDSNPTMSSSYYHMENGLQGMSYRGWPTQNNESLSGSSPSSVQSPPSPISNMTPEVRLSHT
ncbi:THAP domain-containing protein 3 [Halyomorpha halys]|uniref:THAP domain-containing protein 3 n=1 Tax=Halyomorpha halys TaxID=286706 RepID=UPI0034D2A175